MAQKLNLTAIPPVTEEQAPLLKTAGMEKTALKFRPTINMKVIIFD
jgi:hypothetical protein